MANDKIIIEFDGDTRKLRSQLKGVDKDLNDIDSSVIKTGKSLKNVAIVGAAAFAALGASIAFSVKKFATFENELLGVKTLLDDSSFGAKGLEQGFKDMTAEVIELNRKVPVAMGNLNKSLFDTVSAGIDASQAVKVLGVSAKLAVAGLTNVSVATDGMTSAMNAFGLEAEDAEQVASKFFTAQKRGKTTIEQLASGFGIVGSSAAAMGVELNELLGAVSAVTLAGVKTTTAYSGLKAVLANIAKPTADAAKEAKRLGIEFNAASLRSKGLSGFLSQLTDNAKFTKDSVTKLFGSVEAQGIIFALTANEGKAFNSVLTDLNNDTETATTLNDAYTNQSQSLENTLKLLNKQFEIAAITLGEELAPSIKEFGLALIELAPIFTKTAKGLASVINGTIKLGKAFTSPIISAEKLAEVTKRPITEFQRLTRKIKDLEAASKNARFNTSFVEETKVKIIDLKKEIESLVATPISLMRPEENEGEDPIANLEEKLFGEIEARREIEDQAFFEDLERDALKKEQKLAQDQKFQQDRIKLQKDTDDKLRKDKAIADKKALDDQLKTDLAKAKLQQTYANNYISLARNLSNLAVAISGEQNKLTFAISKAAAIAQAIVSTNVAAAQALAVYPAPNVALAGVAKAAGYANVATIAATAIKGFAAGGLVTGGRAGVDSVPALMQQGEIVAPRQNFEEVIGSVRAQREAEALMEEGQASGTTGIELSFRDDVGEFIEATILERRTLGTGSI